MPSRLAGVVVMGRSARLAIAGSGAAGAVGLSAMYAFAILQRRVSSLSVELRARDRFSGRTPSGATIDLTCHW
jgi:hypothetical protein